MLPFTKRMKERSFVFYCGFVNIVIDCENKSRMGGHAVYTASAVRMSLRRRFWSVYFSAAAASTRHGFIGLEFPVEVVCGMVIKL